MDDNHLNEKLMPMTSVSSGDVHIINLEYTLSFRPNR